MGYPFKFMPVLPSVSPLLSEKYLRNRLAPVALLAYQLITAVLFAVFPFLVYRWASRPIAISYAYSAVGSSDQFLHNALANSLRWADLLNEFWIPYLVGLVYLLTSVWVFFQRRTSVPARVFALFASAAAFTIAGVFNHIVSTSLVAFWILAVALAGAALVNLALIFPEVSGFVRCLPIAPWLAYAPVVAFASLPALPLHPAGKTAIVRFSTQAALGFALFGLAVFSLAVIWRRLKSSSPVYRQQASLILYGFLVSFGAATILGIWCFTDPSKANSFTFFIPLVVFPLTVGYTLIRFIPQKTDTFLIKAAVYTVLAFLAGGIYFLLLGGLSLIAGSKIPTNQPFLILLMVFILAVALNPVRDRIQSWVESAFSRQGALYQDQIQVFSSELTQKQDIKAVLASLRSTVSQTLSPSSLHIFLYDALSNQFAAVKDVNGQLSTDLHFPGDSPIIKLLADQPEGLTLRSLDVLPEALKAERNRLALLGAHMFASLPGRNHLVGMLALGPKLSGETYKTQEIHFLRSVSDQAALAIERLQVIENLERRVQEMAVLTRVAQGVNITPQFDDILELIYAQTNAILPTRDFRITLANPGGSGIYHAFYLQQDERINELENSTISVRQGLESQVIQTQRSLLTDDYERECRSQGILPDQNGIYSWLGVPLNTGGETIGSLSLGSREPEVIYTGQQLSLLQAIADQAAGAIVKARLLAETEKRARQLATLNDISRSLTSTLELQPLLSQILNSACSILNCEAGSLFLVDHNTGELVFEVTAGPVADDLIGKRLAPGTGIVGKVVEQTHPIIANQVQETGGWFKQPDQQTGFSTRDLMAVPMMLKESPIGVIELINKRDGSPFTQDDEELLSTLSSQAAVAIENARLYTQTDEALSARLEEMSVLQRIDRELNTSLDVDRTMRITLDWSISQSNADAGLIGFVEEDERENRKYLRLIASKGFSDTGDKTAIREGDRIDLAAVQAAIQDGQPRGINTLPVIEESAHGEELPQGQADPVSLLEGARSQAAVPIRRKSEVIGLLLLESKHPDSFSSETLTFLTRLSDHAAIAISNALLYADLQAANIAKSEFVSLVSHELKTPMTSIRGYTDLLAQGTVGPINDVQANFLNTIRSNVVRMANLVSDLADVSRIEAGRLHLEFRAISIQELVNEVVRSVQAQLNEKEHSLQVTIPEELPQVWGDLNRLIQIMNNLVSNAIKYTPQNGEIAICAELAKNQWDEDNAPQVVHVSVMDNGLGISQEDQSKIFQKFFRSSDQNVRDLPGTGLGLNITRHLVEMQGGRIWFESEIGHGSVFHYTVPVVVTD